MRQEGSHIKRGLNFTDRNTLTQGLAAGESIEQIAQWCHCATEVVQKYLESMDKDEVNKLRSQAPENINIVSLKAQIKRELIEEMRNPPDTSDDLDGVFEELSPQQRGAITRKQNAAQDKADDEALAG
jgi:hypothetical protein